MNLLIDQLTKRQGLWKVFGQGERQKGISYPFTGVSGSERWWVKRGSETRQRLPAFSNTSQGGQILITVATGSIHPTPPLPGFPEASVQPRVWNSIQEQAWQTLFFISMETRACNKTRTPCLKCQNSLTHFPPSDKNKVSSFESCQSWETSQSSSHLYGHLKEEQMTITSENWWRYRTSGHELFCPKGAEAAPNPFCVLVLTFWRDGPDGQQSIPGIHTQGSPSTSIVPLSPSLCSGLGIPLHAFTLLWALLYYQTTIKQLYVST